MLITFLLSCHLGLLRCLSSCLRSLRNRFHFFGLGLSLFHHIFMSMNEYLKEIVVSLAAATSASRV